MTRLKNSFPERIIRVDNCYDCSNYEWKTDEGKSGWCEPSDGTLSDTERMEHINKIGTIYPENGIPENCPLEKVVQIITEAKG